MSRDVERFAVRLRRVDCRNVLGVAVVHAVIGAVEAARQRDFLVVLVGYVGDTVFGYREALSFRFSLDGVLGVVRADARAAVGIRDNQVVALD